MNDKSRKQAQAQPVTGDVPRGSSDERVVPFVVDATTHDHSHLADSDDAVAVILTAERAGGVLAVGAMKPGRVYFVEPDEAWRLVDVKRFQFATEADRDRALAHTQRRADAAGAQLEALLGGGEAPATNPHPETAVAVSPTSEGGGPPDADRHRGGTPVSSDEE